MYDKELAGVGRDKLLRMLKELRGQVDVQRMLERSVERAKLLTENARLKVKLKEAQIQIEELEDKLRVAAGMRSRTEESL